MRVAQEQVEAFHRKMSYPVAPFNHPAPIPKELADQRYRFIAEELNELDEAMADDNLVEVADALADLLYVVLGTAVVFGIDIAPIFNEVHRSNMTKDRLDPITKKGGKGPGFEKPRLAELVLLQMTKLAEPIG